MNHKTDQCGIDSIYNELNHTINNDKNIISHEAKKIIEMYAKDGEQGYNILLNILVLRRSIYKNKLLLIDGLIFNYLYTSNIQTIQDKLEKSFPKGLVPLKKSLKVNYETLQQLLIEQKFQEADALTQKHLCTLAGLNNNSNRQWLYFTDISCIPSEDLFTIDFLWQIYSRGKFGFSIQRKIWIANNYSWDKLWSQIGWTNKTIMRRYPQEFIWNLNAPTGHLPLFNQLRGNQVLVSLFEHIVWNKSLYIN